MNTRVSLGEPRDITKPGDDGVSLEVPFTLTPLDDTDTSRATSHKLLIRLSRSRLSSWKLSDEQARPLMLILGLKHALAISRTRRPKEFEELNINTSTYPGPCPVDPGNLGSSVDTTGEVDREKPPIGFGGSSR